MSSVLENDKETIQDAKLLNDSINQGMGAFTPDMMFEQLVKNYSLAKQIYGQSLLKAITGYDPEYIQKNAKIPEFAREIKNKIKDRLESMQKKNLLDREGHILEKGYYLSSLVMYVEEIDKLEAKGAFGEKPAKKASHYGDREDERNYRKGDRYKDLSAKKTVKTAIRRNHSVIEPADLKVFERKSKAPIYIIYALDASGSMKGEKISLSKKAGVALAYKAIEQKDHVGLIVFGSKVEEKVEPTKDFMLILRTIAKVKASKETNIAQTLEEAIPMFPNFKVTKHLILLTDAVPTAGQDPKKEVLDKVSKAAEEGITISLVGINLDDEGLELAQKIVDIGRGKLYAVKDLENLDQIILEDYNQL